jgi:hypothetical protein
LGQIYSDFLGYLLDHTKSYFEDHIIDGAQIWESYKETMEVVMSYPDGWGAREQSFLRDAAMRAGLSTVDMGLSNIRFLTDAWASAYYCLYNVTLTSKPKVRGSLHLAAIQH